MTPRQIIAVFLRLLCVWFALYVLANIYPVLLQLGKFEALTTAILIGVIALVSLTIILCLWRFSQPIAGTLLPNQQMEPGAQASMPDIDAWFALGCALIGIWELASTVPLLARDLLVLNLLPPGTDTGALGHWPIYYLVRTAIGLWLTLGGNGLRKLFQWARDAGITSSKMPARHDPD